jgi:hypothetical protein
MFILVNNTLDKKINGQDSKQTECGYYWRRIRWFMSGKAAWKQAI